MPKTTPRHNIFILQKIKGKEIKNPGGEKYLICRGTKIRIRFAFSSETMQEKKEE